MGFVPRSYQKDAIDAACDFFTHKKRYNALEIVPTGAGKSVIAANIIGQVGGKFGILQPSKEILEQNFSKYISYGYRGGIYSASAGMKYVDNVTFATIGSIVKKPHLFEDRKWIIDESHLVNPAEGMYDEFMAALNYPKVLGMTATPYRLASSSGGSMLRFLTRQTPRFFNKVIYSIQNKELFDAGHLAKLEYYRFNVIDKTMLSLNSSGSDFTNSSWNEYSRKTDLPKTAAEYANRILVKRKNLLVFAASISDAYKICAFVPGSVVVTGETPLIERANILSEFKKGRIRCVINVGVLTTGFDYPELEAVLLARSTMSLALYYQMIGRCMRPHALKESAWVVDLGGNINKFGRIETMEIRYDAKGLPSVWNWVKNGKEFKQLTNIMFTR